MPCKSEPTTSGVDHFWYQGGEKGGGVCTGGERGWSLHRRGEGVESAWEGRRGGVSMGGEKGGGVCTGREKEVDQHGRGEGGGVSMGREKEVESTRRGSGVYIAEPKKVCGVCMGGEKGGVGRICLSLHCHQHPPDPSS